MDDRLDQIFLVVKKKILLRGLSFQQIVELLLQFIDGILRLTVDIDLDPLIHHDDVISRLTRGVLVNARLRLAEEE